MEGNNPVPPLQDEATSTRTVSAPPVESPRKFLEENSDGIDSAVEPMDSEDRSISTENEANLSPVERSINSAREALSPVNKLGYRLRQLNEDTHGITGTFNGNGRHDEVRPAMFARNTVDAAVTQLTEGIKDLPEDKRAATLDVISPLRAYLPFKARTEDGREISVNTFNTEEEWKDFEEAAKKARSKTDEIREKWKDTVKKDVIDDLWKNPDLDEHTKMVLQWQIQLDKFGPGNKAKYMVAIAGELKRFDQMLKQHSGDLVLFGTDDWNGSLKILATTDGKGITISESGDPNDPRRRIVFGGNSALMVDERTDSEIQAYMEVRDRAELTAALALDIFGLESFRYLDEINSDNPFTHIRFGARANAESINRYMQYTHNPYQAARLGVMLNALGVNPAEFFRDADPNLSSYFEDGNYRSEDVKELMGTFQKKIGGEREYGPPQALKDKEWYST